MILDNFYLIIIQEEFFLEGKYKSVNIQGHMHISEGVSLWKLNENNVVWQEGIEHFNFGNDISIVKNTENRYKETFCFYGEKSNSG